ncbi:MAG: hypothetical protein WBE26_07670 [Phycisphaerae bacterium]
MNFGKIRRNSPTQTKIITIRRGDGGPIAPKVLPFAPSGLHAKVREIEAGEHYKLEISAPVPWPKGEIKETLHLATGLKEVTEVTIRVSGTVVSRLTAVPARFTFPTKRTGEVTRTARLEWDNHKPANILEVTSTMPGAEIHVHKQNRVQILALTVPAGLEPVPGSYAVTIKTDDPDVPTFSIPIRFRNKTALGETLGRGGPESANTTSTGSKSGRRRTGGPIKR